jgi:2-(1,2-epoxy-1,2-dihydrophenyl)acetyl-CoA isomerase
MSYENLLYEVNNRVATITINRPETYNSLSLATISELIQALKAARRDHDVRAIILTGTGNGFSSGADLNELTDNQNLNITEVLRGGLNVLAMLMRSTEKPIICALNGVAAGAGSSIALAADYRIASENASFVFAAFLNIGLVPDGGGTYFLQQLVGPAKALELMLLADAKNRLSADDALRLGVVNRVVSHDALMPEARAIAQKLAAMPTKAIGLTKRALYRSAERNIADALDYEAQLQGIAFDTVDHAEGVAAFREKRDPVFIGE